MRNDGKERELLRERELASSPAEEEEREMKTAEWGGRVGQKKCQPKLVMKGSKRLSPLLFIFFPIILLLAQGMHGTGSRRGNG